MESLQITGQVCPLGKFCSLSQANREQGRSDPHLVILPSTVIGWEQPRESTGSA